MSFFVGEGLDGPETGSKHSLLEWLGPFLELDNFTGDCVKDLVNGGGVENFFPERGDRAEDEG